MNVYTPLVSVVIAASALAADQVWSGTISDGFCGVRHTMAEQHGKNTSDRDCTQACARQGIPYALVADGKVYRLRNHESDLRTHAGHMVNVSGTLMADTIRVSKVEMPAEKH